MTQWLRRNQLFQLENKAERQPLICISEIHHQARYQIFSEPLSSIKYVPLKAIVQNSSCFLNFFEK